MTVSLDTAAGSFEHDSKTYWFCSKHCLARFQSDPKAFLNKTAAPMMAQPVGIQHFQPQSKANAHEKGSDYTCPMHPAVRQPHGSCPTCGMALEPATLTAPKQQIE